MKCQRILLFLTTIILVKTSNGKKCYAPANCVDGDASMSSWIQVFPPLTCIPENLARSRTDEVVNAAINPIAKDVDELKSKNIRISEDVSTLDQKLSVVNETVVQLKSKDIEPLQISNDVINETLQTQEQTIRNVSNRVELAFKENEMLKTDGTETKQALQNVTKFMKSLQEENEKLKHGSTERNQALQYVTRIMKNLQKDNERLTLESIEMNHTIQAVEERMKYMKQKMQKLYPFRARIDEEGWTVFQRRQDGSVSFNRPWIDYVNGFGNPYGNFWMGLARLHEITSSGNYELRIDLEDWENGTAYAHYSDFSVGNASTNFQLNIGYYSGTAGDSLRQHNGMAFSTFDSDHDTSGNNCAERYKGGWWYASCFSASLNGAYYIGGTYTGDWPYGIVWSGWKGYYYSIKFFKMKFRRKN